MIKELFFSLMKKYSDNESYINICWLEIYKNYNLKNRYYHNFEHLDSMINGLNEIKTHVTAFDTLLFSIFYHDIIYKSYKKNNETKSALLFKKRISKTNFNSITLCIQQIEATKEHKRSTDLDTNILFDLDLLILGSSKDTYQKYYQNIRKEYSIFPDFIYNKERKKVLEHLLKLPSIFKTSYFVNAYEEKAKINLSFELNQLIKR